MTSAPRILDRLEIEGLAFGGSGIGHFDGKAVFVPLTAPGDVVTCRIIKEKRHFCYAEAETYIRESSFRRKPVCPVFGTCGGCQWQHLPYPVQLQWKETIFFDTLARLGKIQGQANHSVLSAPSEWHYRSRIQIKCHWDGNRLAMGFFRRGSHFVVDTTACPIAHPLLNKAWGDLREALKDHTLGPNIPQIDLDAGEGNKVRVVVHYLGKDFDSLKRAVDPWARSGQWSWFVQSGRKSTLQRVRGTDHLEFTVGDPPMKLVYGPGGFAQVNLAQNRYLVDWVVEQAALTGREKVLDLFCGTGNFSLPLARRGLILTGIEEFSPAIELAERNARENHLANTEFFAESSLDAVMRLNSVNQGFDLIVLDPPREGAAETVRSLVALKAPRIIYISCDPPTLARDLKTLVDGGYRVVSARPIDLFPQTHHIEGVVLLEIAS